jgi:Fe2+ transport system protein B
VESFDPKLGRKVGLNKKSADNVIGGANHAFSFSILWGCMRTRQTKRDAISRKKRTKFIVNKFTTIITLQAFYNSMKLSFDVGEEKRWRVEAVLDLLREEMTMNNVKNHPIQ